MSIAVHSEPYSLKASACIQLWVLTQNRTTILYYAWLIVILFHPAGPQWGSSIQALQNNKYKKHYEPSYITVFRAYNTRFFGHVGILIELNLDLSGIGVRYLGESFLREINGCLASCRTEVDYLNQNAAASARMRCPLVCCAGALNSEAFVAYSPVVPYCIACCGYHDSIIFVSVACRGCKRD